MIFNSTDRIEQLANSSYIKTVQMFWANCFKFYYFSIQKRKITVHHAQTYT